MAANVNNYIAAGNAAVKNSYAALAAARDNSPKYDEIAKEGMKARAEQKIAAMKADSNVKRTQIKANSYLERSKLASETNKSVKKKTQFAGKIAAAGALMATSLLPAAEIIKPRERDFSGQEARIREGLQRAESDIEKFSTPKPTPDKPTATPPATNSNTATFITGNTGIGTGPHLDARVWDTSKNNWVKPTGLYEQYITGPDGQTLQSYGMTSGYGNRTAPVPGASTFHPGEDWATPEGTRLTVNLQPLTGKWGRRHDKGGGYTTGYQIPDSPYELHLMHGQRLAHE